MSHAFAATDHEPQIGDLLDTLLVPDAPPAIDHERLRAYRLERVREQVRLAGAAMAILVNPISLRYACDYRNYGLFQSHIPTFYAFVPAEGPVVLYSGYGDDFAADENRPGRAISFFEAGPAFDEPARQFAQDVVDYLSEIGTNNRRVAVEYVNPSLTQALMQRGLEVTDGVTIAEMARVIKSDDEIACMRWACAVAHHGIDRLRAALKPGVSELQLWSLAALVAVSSDHS